MIKKILSVFAVSTLSLFIFGCEDIKEESKNEYITESNQVQDIKDIVVNKEIKINESEIEEQKEYTYINDYINIEIVKDYNYINSNYGYEVIENISNIEQREIFIKNRVEELIGILVEDYGFKKKDFENVKIKIVHGKMIKNNEQTVNGFVTETKDIYLSSFNSRKNILKTILHEFGHYVGYFNMTSEDYYDYFTQRKLNEEQNYEVLNKEKEVYVKENEYYLDRIEKEIGLAWEEKLEETLAEDFVQMINNNKKINQEFVINECKTINQCPTIENTNKLEKIIKKGKDRLTK